MSMRHDWMIAEEAGEAGKYLVVDHLNSLFFDKKDILPFENISELDTSTHVAFGIEPHEMDMFLKLLRKSDRERIQVLHRDEECAFWLEYKGG